MAGSHSRGDKSNAKRPGALRGEWLWDIAELHFHVIGPVSSSSGIDFANGVFKDISANQMPATWTGKVSIEVYEPGDANNDGSVNNLDITRLEMIIVGLDNSIPGADANGDGNVNALDITKVEMVIMGK
jgi:hypothetical protein